MPRMGFEDPKNKSTNVRKSTKEIIASIKEAHALVVEAIRVLKGSVVPDDDEGNGDEE